MPSLGELYPQMQAHVREVLGQYKQIGPAGQIGAALIEQTLKRADEAAMSGDVVAMLRCYEEMKGIE